MRWPRTTLALAPLLLLAAACSSHPPGNTVVEVPCDGFSSSSGEQVRITRQVAVSEGATIVLRLCANPTTGFEWEDAVVSKQAVLVEQSREFIPPGVTMPGSAGLEQWTFQATSRGSCLVTLSYSRPWEGGEKGVWLFELHVSVD